MKKILILSVLIIIFLAGCVQQEAGEEQTQEAMEDAAGTAEGTETQAEQAASYVDVSPAEAKELIDTTDIIVIDVSPHYDKGHLPGAVSYYLGDGSLDAAIPSLDKEATYLVYCHVDSVAILGAQKLIDAGFKSVYRLEGNYRGWVEAGYPIET